MASSPSRRHELLSESPLSGDEAERLLRVLESIPRRLSVREALLEPTEKLMAGDAAFTRLRAAFPRTGPFSFIELGDALLIWAVAARTGGFDGRLEEAIAALFVAGREHFATLSLFQPLLLSSERDFGRFVGLGGAWRALMANFGQVEVEELGEDALRVEMRDDHTASARYYIPGFYRTWMRLLGSPGELHFQPLGEARYRLDIFKRPVRLRA